MEFNWITCTVLPLAGFVGMVAGGYWAVGCSWLIVPVTLLLGATPMEAAGIALLQMTPSLLPVVIRDVPKLGWRKGDFGRGLILPLAVASMVFSFAGRPLNVYFYERFGNIVFQSFFAAVQVVIGFNVIFGRVASYGAEIPSFGGGAQRSAAGFGAFAGLISSFLGIGGGMLFRPLLANYYKLPEKETANGTRTLLFATAFAGGIAYIFGTDGIHWRIPCFAMLTALGGVLGFPLGVRIHRVVHGNGYAIHIHRSFAMISGLIVFNLVLTLAGLVNLSRWVMIGFAAGLLAYFFIFAKYTEKYPLKHRK